VLKNYRPIIFIGLGYRNRSFFAKNSDNFVLNNFFFVSIFEGSFFFHGLYLVKGLKSMIPKDLRIFFSTISFHKCDCQQLEADTWLLYSAAIFSFFAILFLKLFIRRLLYQGFHLSLFETILHKFKPFWPFLMLKIIITYFKACFEKIWAKIAFFYILNLIIFTLTKFLQIFLLFCNFWISSLIFLTLLMAKFGVINFFKPGNPVLYFCFHRRLPEIRIREGCKGRKKYRS